MLTIGIYLFDQAELLDFAGPLEVFTTANRLHEQQTKSSLLRVITLSASGEPVRCRAGLHITPDTSLADCPALDVFIVPGGRVEAERDNPALNAWLIAQRPHISTLASICNGAFILAGAGLLDNLSVTTHWEDAAQLAREFSQVNVQPEHRFIDHGHTFTTAGVAAGIDACLHWVASNCSTPLATATARQMDYPWAAHASHEEEIL
ncbi:DJ-1/PfpI family protein [Simiduia sp. 21SJ11W-1]|uniref:GlxA family transcriptional regulator n=1 Tax=Simiduia sp. 21SJ11W-1 TaxID=2909669 RepID=UPI0020A18224|nr:DJ-1/PfpI family protein [Simiduia sp. 21SJ11W-1]UTA48168.1 DJ-1/PfpI family protein [Simiduia sp. 21SJ11W-1]